MCSKCAKWIHRISCWKTRELDIQIGFNDNEFDEIILLILSFISILVFVLTNPLSDDDSYFTTPVFSVKIQIFVWQLFFNFSPLKSGDWKSICTQSKVSIFRDRSVIDSSFIGLFFFLGWRGIFASISHQKHELWNFTYSHPRIALPGKFKYRVAKQVWNRNLT